METQLEGRNSQIGPNQPKRAEALAVAVAYEDTQARNRAMLLCDHLVNQLWEDVDFEISWWRFDYLHDARIAAAAAAAAGSADMVIFSADANRELKGPIKEWIETWTARRAGREGAVVSLTAATGVQPSGMGPVQSYLRDVARQAGMDFLSNLPSSRSEPLNGSIESILHRATAMTSVMERILKQVSPPSHWGINE